MADLRMPRTNILVIDGNIAHTPELLYAASGKPWAKARIAHTVNKDTTVWLDVKAFNKTAEILVEQPKGTPVQLQGRLAYDEWEDKNNGQKRTKHYMIADRVNPLAWRDDAAEPTPEPEPTPEDDIPF